jgi:hypothetical protein
MPETRYMYEVQLPLIGSPNVYFPVCRALTADGAAEVVRILLAQRDPDVSEVRVIVRADNACTR